MKDGRRIISLPQSTFRDPGGDIVKCPLTGMEFIRNGNQFLRRTGAELPKPDQAHYASY